VADEHVDQTDEDLAVRLSWPKPAAAAPETAAPAQPPARTRATVRPVVPRIEAPRAGDGAAPTATAGAVPASPSAWASPAPASEREPVAARREARIPEAIEAAAGLDAGAPGRVFVEAFDRLADRLLDRLRTLRQDVDTDLGAVRTEVAALRQAVDDLGDRTQVRQVLAGIDELRSELSALRRAVLEWPELEQVSNDIAAVRGDLAFVFETAEGGMGGPPSDLLAELERTIGTLSDEISRLGQEVPQAPPIDSLVEEVAAMRAELTQVRRRVAVRKGPLNPEQLEQIVSAVAERVLEELQAAERRPRRR
jgi:regulator of replication initiation timing